ncbi:DNA polymerase alpha/epsilon subunit B-domain-containing protein [Gaertneriomyces semiglobifer]|nr:DNA polymerase alpha/epsilon subunit B-domain-containing protein [Gaertneriomyces semiglobifer]
MSAKQHIHKIFARKHGLTLKTDALRYLLDITADLPAEELPETLDFVAQTYIQQIGQTVVDRTNLEEVVGSIFKKAAVNQALQDGIQQYEETGVVGGMAGQVTVDDISAYLQVIDAFDVARYRWRTEAKTFDSYQGSNHLLAAANQKVLAYKDRYDLIKQRILRNDAFRASTFSKATDYFHITPIKNLQGQKPGPFLLFGMLTQVEEGKCHLEDPDSLIELELTGKIDRGIGLFTMNSFVLVEGLYTEDRTFRVKTFGMPLPETREKSLSAFGNNVNFFGGSQAVDDVVVLSNIETSMNHVMMVIVSDVWLDQPRVVTKLRRMFEGFSAEDAVRPLAFIFMGNFMSTPYIFDAASAQTFKECFNTLADLLADFREIAQQSHFIFVPGPHDPWGSNTFPRPGIPDFFTQRLRSKVPKAKFASNPCRIKYCTQEIVIFREDLANRMRRNCIVAPSNDLQDPLEKHLVSTIIDQAHLCPLPINVCPTYWSFDHALRLYPPPHLLVLADRYDTYTVDYNGCKGVNPGSFPNSEFTFMIYYPSSKTCQIR